MFSSHTTVFLSYISFCRLLPRACVAHPISSCAALLRRAHSTRKQCVHGVDCVDTCVVKASLYRDRELIEYVAKTATGWVTARATEADVEHLRVERMDN